MLKVRSVLPAIALDIKSDGVQRGLVGKIIERLSKKAFCLLVPSSPVNCMSSGLVVPMVWDALNAVKTGRQMLGATNPAVSLLGTIRGDFGIQVDRNILHGSDAVESAQKEVGLWFIKNCLTGNQMLLTGFMNKL